MKALISVIKGYNEGFSISCNSGDKCLFGRKIDKLENGYFPLNDRYASVSHARLIISSDTCSVSDLNSRNGTFIIRTHADRTVFCLEGKRQQKEFIKTLQEDFNCENFYQVNNPFILKNNDLLAIGKTILQIRLFEESYDSMTKTKDNVSDLKIQKEKKHTRNKIPDKHFIRCSFCGEDITSQLNKRNLGKNPEFKHTYSCRNCAYTFKTIDSSNMQIDEYYLMKSIGSGTFGNVYLAWSEKTFSLLAFKLSKEEIKDNKDSNKFFNRNQVIKRFEREINIMKNLVHPNVVAFYDWGLWEKKIYLVSEYMSEGNIERLLKNRYAGKMCYVDAISLIIQALDGLSNIHENGFVHRDIKPGNILIKKQSNSSLIAKIADFGLAKSFISRGYSITKTGDIPFGTLQFIAPEQLKNIKYVKPASDIYSVGAILYYLITGKYPFMFPNRRERSTIFLKGKIPRNPISIITNDEPVPVEKIDPNIPEILANAVNKAISKNVDGRFKTAREFIHELEKILFLIKYFCF